MARHEKHQCDECCDELGPFIYEKDDLSWEMCYCGQCYALISRGMIESLEARIKALEAMLETRIELVGSTEGTAQSVQP